ncbi:Uncharacterised protein [Mycobacteroides abscessus subsp. abscessus]|nr:Uncharacterised protein [Mycobacteroides abscessus subsp. abscessus]
MAMRSRKRAEALAPDSAAFAVTSSLKLASMVFVMMDTPCYFGLRAA